MTDARYFVIYDILRVHLRVMSHLILGSGFWLESSGMKQPVSYKGHRFPPQIIAHAVRLYFRFTLSFRLIEEMRLLTRLRPELEGSNPHVTRPSEK